MSQAFIKEQDPDAPVVLPDRPVSQHTNYVTLQGYELLCQQKTALEKELSNLSNSKGLNVKSRTAEIKRDLRYLIRRIESAEKVGPTNTQNVRFGCTVNFVDQYDTKYQYQIVGEDEADVKEHKISWTSPLAKLLIGKSVEETINWTKGTDQLEIEITEILAQTKPKQAN